MIQVEHAAVREGEVTLLAETSLRAEAGDAVIVRGANGAGKSTLLRLIAGMREPSRGTVSVGGRAPASPDPRFRRSLAAMIGLPPMAPDLTVRDHVLLVAATWAESGPEAERIAQEVLAEFGLEALARRFPHELSSGQTQLFGLALVLARPFDALVLDEPEQRLDADRIVTVIAAVRRRQALGATVVIATHSDAIEAGLDGHTVWLREAA